MEKRGITEEVLLLEHDPESSREGPERSFPEQKAASSEWRACNSDFIGPCAGGGEENA